MTTGSAVTNRALLLLHDKIEPKPDDIQSALEFSIDDKPVYHTTDYIALKDALAMCGSTAKSSAHNIGFRELGELLIYLIYHFNGDGSDIGRRLSEVLMDIRADRNYQVLSILNINSRKENTLHILCDIGEKTKRFKDSKLYKLCKSITGGLNKKFLFAVLQYYAKGKPNTK